MDSKTQQQVFEFKKMLDEFKAYINSLPNLKEMFEAQKLEDAQRIVSLQFEVKRLSLRFDALEAPKSNV